MFVLNALSPFREGGKMGIVARGNACIVCGARLTNELPPRRGWLRFRRVVDGSVVYYIRFSSRTRPPASHCLLDVYFHGFPCRYK